MPKLHFVTDGGPPGTRELFRSACLARDLEFVTHRARSYEFLGESVERPGEVFYQAGVSGLASAVARELAGQGATGLRDGRLAGGPAASVHQMQQAGVPVLACALCSGHNRGAVNRTVERLGGLPVVVKVPGGEGGIGVMLAETKPALFGLIDYLAAAGVAPLLSAFVPDAIHWRCIVLGERVLLSYRNEMVPDDFRTHAPTTAAGYVEDAPEDVSVAAVRAVVSLGLDFGGVDVLVGKAGDMHVLEVNSPCNFAEAQQLTGVDIAGAVVDQVVARVTQR